MTNPRETSVMLPVEPSEAVIEAMDRTMDAWNLYHEPRATVEIYRAIIAAHMQEMDE